MTKFFILAPLLLQVISCAHKPEVIVFENIKEITLEPGTFIMGQQGHMCHYTKNGTYDFEINNSNTLYSGDVVYDMTSESHSGKLISITSKIDDTINPYIMIGVGYSYAISNKTSRSVTLFAYDGKLQTMTGNVKLSPVSNAKNLFFSLNPGETVEIDGNTTNRSIFNVIGKNGLCSVSTETPTHVDKMKPKIFIDTNEVSVYQFSRFIMNYKAPSVGDGKFDTFDGWKESYNKFLPKNSDELSERLLGDECAMKSNNWESKSYPPGVNNSIMSMDCVSWYEAYAYCIWNGKNEGYRSGHLPSEAEYELLSTSYGYSEFPYGNFPYEKTESKYLDSTRNEIAFGIRNLITHNSEFMMDEYDGDDTTVYRNDNRNVTMSSGKGFNGSSPVSLTDKWRLCDCTEWRFDRVIGRYSCDSEINCKSASYSSWGNNDTTGSFVVSTKSNTTAHILRGGYQQYEYNKKPTKVYASNMTDFYKNGKLEFSSSSVSRGFYTDDSGIKFNGRIGRNSVYVLSFSSDGCDGSDCNEIKNNGSKDDKLLAHNSPSWVLYRVFQNDNGRYNMSVYKSYTSGTSKTENDITIKYEYDDFTVYLNGMYRDGQSYVISNGSQPSRSTERSIVSSNFRSPTVGFRCSYSR